MVNGDPRQGYTNLNLDVMKTQWFAYSPNVYFLFMKERRVHYKKKFYATTLNPLG